MDIKVLPSSPSVVVAVLKSPTATHNELKENAGWFVLDNVNISHVRVASGKNSYTGKASISLARMFPSNGKPRVTLFTAQNPETKVYRVEDIELEAGDWVAIWMNNSIKCEYIQQAIAKYDANTLFDYDSGFKFLGRVMDITHSTRIAPNGAKQYMQTISADSFHELSAQIYYNPFFASNELPTNVFGELLQQAITNMTNQSNSDSNTIDSSDTQELVCTVAQVLLGDEVPDTAPRGATLLSSSKLGTGGLKIPPALANLFRVPLDDSKAERFLSIYNVYVGIQKYNNSYTPTPLAKPPSRYYKTIIQTDKALLGKYPVFPTPWHGTPIWSILGEYANKSINEMYTAFRWDNEQQLIKPTIMIRQFPFVPKNDTIDKGLGSKFAYTKYSEIPQWVIPDTFVQSYDWSLSNEMRTNMVVMIPQVENLNPQINSRSPALINPPYDEQDALYNGLKLYSTSMHTMVIPTGQAGSDVNQFFNELMRTRMFDGQSRRIGSISTVGIIDPICIGDNLLYEDYVHHIESVTHEIRCMSDGKVTFTTNISFSFGTHKDEA